MSANIKALVSALALASKAVKALPPAPSFDHAARLAIMLSAFEGMPDAEKKARNATDRLKEQFDAAHGDSSERITRTVLAELAESLGGIETLATVAGRMAKESRSAGKVNATATQWRAALTEEEGFDKSLQGLAEKASDMRKAGKAWSEVEESLSLSPAARSQLYLVAKEFTDLFPAKAE
jgi:hypothetical protein